MLRLEREEAAVTLPNERVRSSRLGSAGLRTVGTTACVLLAAVAYGGPDSTFRRDRGGVFVFDAKGATFQSPVVFDRLVGDVVERYNRGLQAAKARLDHRMAAPRGEFETTAAALARMRKYDAAVLREVAAALEGTSYRIENLSFPAHGKTLVYDADRQAFRVWGDVWVGLIRWPSTLGEFRKHVKLPPNSTYDGTPLFHRTYGSPQGDAVPGLDFGRTPPGMTYLVKDAAAAREFKRQVEAGDYSFQIRWDFDAALPGEKWVVDGGGVLFTGKGTNAGSVRLRFKLAEFVVIHRPTGKVRFDVIANRAIAVSASEARPSPETPASATRAGTPGAASRTGTSRSSQRRGQLATAHVAIAGQSDLEAGGVIERRGAFIGMQGAWVESPVFDPGLFEEIDVRQKTEFAIDAPRKRVKVVSVHPPGSYELVAVDEGRSRLRVTDATAFWSQSDYLVVARGN